MRRYSTGAFTYKPCSDLMPRADIISSSVKDNDNIGVRTEA
jgi:hypothetical protein